MSEGFLNILNNCQPSTQKNFLAFLKQLSPQPKIEQSETSPSRELEQLFNTITQPFSIHRIREISKEERSQKQLTHYQFNYGQITFSTIQKIMGLVRKYKTLEDNDIFYDLGSGSGKVLFAASLCHSFKTCKGIEYLQKLYKVSVQLRAAIDEHRDVLEETLGESTMPEIELYNADFEEYDWSDGTVIFVSSTCYTRQVMQRIERLCDKLSKGTVLITLSKGLQSSDDWKLVEKFNGTTSWGSCSVFLHLKVR